MRLFLASALLFAVHANAEAWELSYWAWNRAEPLTEVERGALHAQGVGTIFWHAGELDNSGTAWRWKSRFPVPASTAELRMVPVVRLELREREPFAEAAMAALLDVLAPVMRDAPELQIDFDCPDRLLPAYASALRTIRAHVPRLSITALPAWSRDSAQRELAASVDELAPMLYDFAPDPAIGGASTSPIPLLTRAKVEAQLAAWDKCKIPWRAGLPTFARLTVFDAAGKSRGHIRNWSWSDICFNAALVPVRPTADGLTLFRARSDGTLAETPLAHDEAVATRWPDRATLASAVAFAKKTSARGVTFFRLPDATDPSGWSLRQLGHLESSTPNLVCKIAGPHQLALVNDSDADLEPRFSAAGAVERGYTLEIASAALLFREALAGEFWSVTGRASEENSAAPIAVPLAHRLVFRFSNLRAGESLRSGSIQLAPGADLRQLRYRVPELERTWKNIAD